MNVGPLPHRAGWYRLDLGGLPDCEVVGLDLDFGLGFVGWHSLRVFPHASEATLFVRLFKPLRAVRLVTFGGETEGQPQISFDRLSAPYVLRRRAAEQMWLAMRFLRRLGTASGVSTHDRPRRLWKWRGLQAFPANLRATGKSSYAQWRCLTSGLNSAVPSVVSNDWLVVMDLRCARVEKGALVACATAAKNAGASLRVVVERGDARALEQAIELVTESCVTSCEASDEPLLDHLELDRFSWIVHVPAGVSLARPCLSRLAAVGQDSSVACIYADNDHADSRGRRCHPEFRTRFSPERLKQQDWLGRVVAYRLEAVAHAEVRKGGSRESHRYQMALNILRAIGPSAFVHIPDILYSCPTSPCRSAEGAFHCSEIANATRSAPDSGPKIDWASRTTIIIPTRNRADLVDRCVSSILDAGSSSRAEIVIHDNGSDEPETLLLLERLAEKDSIRVVRDELPFNYSRINNDAAAIARGELLVFLNNDTEVVSADWLDVLCPIAMDTEAGAVGPLLLDRRGRIQHAGIVTGPGGIAAHVHEGLRPEECDPIVPLVRRNVSAVTGACMVVEKRKFLSAGGFDDKGLAVAFNDVDLCLRMERRGYRNIFAPEVALIHEGSASREPDDFTRGADRFRGEFKLMRSRWGERLDVDPYLPHHMQLFGSVPRLRLA